MFAISCDWFPIVRTMSESTGGWGYFAKFSVGMFARDKIKWTQSDLKFSKSEGSIRTKTNEKGGQLDRKLRRKMMQHGEKWSKIVKTCLN